MSPEKKNRLIAIIALIVSIICIILTVTFIIRFIQVKQEYDNQRSATNYISETYIDETTTELIYKD